MWLKIACLLSATVAPLLAREIMSDEWAARLAHAQLDSLGWAQVVRIENEIPSRDYPRKTWATVFELEGRLWIYLPREGTSSISRFQGRLESDKADLRDVLEHVHVGFRSYRVKVEDSDSPTPAWAREAGALPNGCLVDAVRRYHQLVDAGREVVDALLLMYYGGRGVSNWGHTVLCFKTVDGWFYWDAKGTERMGEIGHELPDDPLRLARMTIDDGVGSRLVKARILPISG